jgi:hypothetical protein
MNSNEMENTKCIAIKRDGSQCDNRKNATCGDGLRCKIHFTSHQYHGPETTKLNELKYLQSKEIGDIPDGKEHNDQRTIVRRRYKTQILEITLSDVYTNEIRMKQEDTIRRREEIRRRFAPQGIGLHQFTQDRQNIHTSAVVTQTNDVIKKILEISVPAEYAWNSKTCSRTPFEIGLECALTPKSTQEMIRRYCSHETVEDRVPGIYGKVLDAVWQFTKSSEDKVNLCKIIKQEMEDNVGMCTQGNLYRLCNILAGYVDGVGVSESITELLGRLLPPLMDVEDVNERLLLAAKILKENGVPNAEWKAWTDPLFE